MPLESAFMKGRRLFAEARVHVLRASRELIIAAVRAATPGASTTAASRMDRGAATVRRAHRGVPMSSRFSSSGSSRERAREHRYIYQSSP